jgi:hypothetical protein
LAIASRADGRSLQSTQARLTTERAEIVDMMGEVKLFGANSACDGTLAATLRRNQERQRIAGKLSTSIGRSDVRAGG